jgi:hypothetical protein
LAALKLPPSSIETRLVTARIPKTTSPAGKSEADNLCLAEPRATLARLPACAPKVSVHGPQRRHGKRRILRRAAVPEASIQFEIR